MTVIKYCKLCNQFERMEKDCSTILKIKNLVLYYHGKFLCNEDKDWWEDTACKFCKHCIFATSLIDETIVKHFSLSNFKLKGYEQVLSHRQAAVALSRIVHWKNNYLKFIKEKELRTKNKIILAMGNNPKYGSKSLLKILPIELIQYISKFIY